MMYSTIARDGSAEVEFKRSRFICQLRRVEDEYGARAVIVAARKEHWDARHHCSAFVLGPSAGVRRSNDDGEPAGTAGAPMLDVLTRREVSDVVAVVIRYFGGVLLGAGGLVHAYSESVSVALDEVGLQRRELRQLVEVSASHADAGRLENDLRAHAVMEHVAYGENVTFTVAIPAGDVDVFDQQVAAMSAGTAVIRTTETRWVDVS